jgi:hypothetical protein
MDVGIKVTRPSVCAGRNCMCDKVQPGGAGQPCMHAWPHAVMQMNATHQHTALLAALPRVYLTGPVNRTAGRR